MAFEQTIGGIDFPFLPPNFNGDVQVFMSNNNAQGTQKWVKPRGVTMCYMEAISSGCGGGGGRTGATTTARGGGGGGCSGNVAKLLIPAIFVPDVLWIQVGAGGPGGSANNPGTIGANTFISYGAGVTGLSTIPNRVLLAAASNQTAATAGTAAAAGSGGIIGSIAAQSDLGATATHGFPAFIVGTSGTAGGVQTGAVGVAMTAVWNLVAISGGTGGGGVNTVNSGFIGGNLSLQSSLDYAEGTITPAASYLAGGVAGSASAAGNGNAGVQLWKPFYMTGGTGGGSSDGSTGGNGGRGGIGCGGGGGGGGTTGGTGGDGGDGFAIIISW